MNDTPFYVPRLVAEGAWLDWRGEYPGGFAGFGSRALNEIRFAAPHHSVTNPTGNAKKDVDTLYNIHAANGWGMIGYNFVVTSEVTPSGFAKVAYVGDIASVRAHTVNSKGAMGMAAGLGNRYIVAACMIGQNHVTMPTQAQLRSMKLLMEELLFFENERLPNLWPQWDDMQPHYVWDWTQCNGMPHIRQAIIDEAIPAKIEAPAPKPTPTPAPAGVKYETIAPKTVELKRPANLWNFNFNEWRDAKAVREYPAGHKIDVVAIATNALGGRYYMTAHSYNGGSITATNGFNVDDARDYLAPVPEPIPTPAPSPAPTPTPEPVEKPVVRALGEVMTVKVNDGDKVIDVITGKTARGYSTDEPFDATHTVEWKGVKYYMTAYGYLEYQKGKNPTGIDITTVDAWVNTPTEPDTTTPPAPIEDRPETPVDMVKEHDRIVRELEGRLTILEKFVDLLKKAWRAIFNREIGE